MHRNIPFLLCFAAFTGCNRKDGDQSTSRTARVVAKSGEVWGRDLAQGLGLQEWELCKELGTTDCISEAHRITLGGVEPEVLGIDDPVEVATVSAPIAVDRVALSACGERYTRDADGTAVIYGPVLEKNSKRSREAVSEQLIVRLLSRHPTKEEVDGLVDLYETIEPLTDTPVRDWAIGACVVVATSTEALFY